MLRLSTVGADGNLVGAQVGLELGSRKRLGIEIVLGLFAPLVARHASSSGTRVVPGLRDARFRKFSTGGPLFPSG